MSDLEDTTTLAQTEPETPAIEKEEPTTIPEFEPGPEEEDGGDAAADIVELGEWERDGKKYQVPKDLLPHLMKDGDYTQKTQKHAEERRAFEAEKLRRTEFNEELLSTHADIKHAERQLAHFEKIDWAKAKEADWVQAHDQWQLRQQWSEHHQKLLSRADNLDRQAAGEAQQVFAKRLQDADVEMSRNVKGWDTGIAQKVTEHAANMGIPFRDLAQLTAQHGTTIVKLVHDAWLGSQLKAAATKTTKQPAVEQPLATVTARSGSPATRKSLGDMSMEEYAKARAAGRSA